MPPPRRRSLARVDGVRHTRVSAPKTRPRPEHPQLLPSDHELSFPYKSIT